MAKRKRLTPPQRNLGEVSQETETNPAQLVRSEAALPRLNARPPIADVARDATTMAAFNEMTQILEEARSEGRLILRLNVWDVDESYIVRDRIESSSDDMEALVESLRARGQQTAIEVTDLGQGKYGLISGWRRLKALRKLSEEGGTETVLALVRAPAEQQDAYLSMVEENEIRANLSFYERANIVVRATGAGVFPNDRVALSTLFASASRSKRSKIGSFVKLVRALGDVLSFPTALTERTGLGIVQAMDADPQVQERLHAALERGDPRSADEEAALIAGVLGADVSEAPAPQVLSETKPAQPVGKSATTAPQPDGFEVRDGLYVRETRGGLLLSGDVLRSDGFKERLLAFLSEN